MATKKKALPSMKPTRQKRPAKVVEKPFKLLRSTPQGTDMFDQEFPTLASVKTAARNVFKAHVAWTLKYPSTSDVGALERAIEVVDTYTGETTDPLVVEARFDTLYDMTARVAIWRG